MAIAYSVSNVRPDVSRIHQRPLSLLHSCMIVDEASVSTYLIGAYGTIARTVDYQMVSRKHSYDYLMIRYKLTKATRRLISP